MALWVNEKAYRYFLVKIKPEIHTYKLHFERVQTASFSDKVFKKKSNLHSAMLLEVYKRALPT